MNPCLRLSIVDYGPTKKDHPQDAGTISIRGRTADEVIQEVWNSFQITQEGDRELIAQTLSSPSEYDHLSFFFKGPVEKSYRITVVDFNKADFFPRRPIDKEKLTRGKESISYSEVDFNGRENSSEDHFNFDRIVMWSVVYPEMSALYNAESFSTLMESSTNAFPYRMFRIK